MAPKALLRARKLVFRYPGAPLLLGPLDMDIHPGEMTLLLGKTGRESTPSLAVWPALLKRARFFWVTGTEGRSASGARTDHGACSPEPASGTGFRVAEMVATGRMPYLGSIPLKRTDRAVVDRVLEECGVHHLREAIHCARREKERILLARALAQEPRLLLLDEPTSAQDPGQRGNVLSILKRRVNEEGLAVLMVTHDWSLPGILGCPLHVLDEGQLVFGEVANVLTPERIQQWFGNRASLIRGENGVLFLAPRIQPVDTP